VRRTTVFFLRAVKARRTLRVMKPVLSYFLMASLAVSSLRAHDVAAEMAAAAKNFLAALDDSQKSRARFDLKSDLREDWHFIPKPTRPGIMLKDLTPAQHHLAYALLGTGLSTEGFIKASTIMSLEQILHELENRSPTRDPGKYYFSIFGDPGKDPTWGWRCEGHHCSVNFTIVNGQLSGTPNFFGSNPGEVMSGPRQGLRVLAGEEEAGRTLVKHLNDDQKKVAIIPGGAPKDILSEALRTANPLSPAGLPAATMTAEQKRLLHDIIDTYIGRARPALAAAELAQIEKAGFDAIHFVWMGGTERGEPHYYRVQGPTFLIEYDNTQNGANHPHAVWREFKGDFGRDLLAEHYKATH
jgi:Protein of unknown function (DUF3500)